MVGAYLGFRPNFIEWMKCLLLQRIRASRIPDFFTACEDSMKQEREIMYNYYIACIHKKRRFLVRFIPISSLLKWFDAT